MGALGISNPTSDDDMAMFADEDLPSDEPGGAPEAPATEPPAADDAPPPVATPELYPGMEPEETEAAPAVQAPAEEEAAEEQTPEALWAGKFQTPEALESSYREIQRAFTQVAQDNRSQSEQYQQAQQVIAQQGEQIDAMMQYLQAQAAEDNPDLAQQLQTQQQTQQQIQAARDQMRQEFEQQRQQDNVRQQQQTAAANVTAFYQEHPEIVPGSPAEIALTERVKVVVDTLARSGVNLDFGERAQLDLAVEAAMNEQFGAELMMNPNAVYVPGGVDRLRERSGATIAAQRQETPQPGTRPQPQPARRVVEGFVETGSGGAPAAAAPGETGEDEFDEAVKYYRTAFNKGPLFGQGA